MSRLNRIAIVFALLIVTVRVSPVTVSATSPQWCAYSYSDPVPLGSVEEVDIGWFNQTGFQSSSISWGDSQWQFDMQKYVPTNFACTTLTELYYVATHVYSSTGNYTVTIAGVASSGTTFVIFTLHVVDSSSPPPTLGYQNGGGHSGFEM